MSSERMQELERENNSLKTGVQSIKVLKKSLKEKSDCAGQIVDYKRCVQNLQRRLHENNLSSSVNLIEDELSYMSQKEGIGQYRRDREVVWKETLRLQKLVDAKLDSDELLKARKTIASQAILIDEHELSSHVAECDYKKLLKDTQSSPQQHVVRIGQLTDDLKKYYAQRLLDDDVRVLMCGEVFQTKLKMDVLVEEMKSMSNEISRYRRVAQEEDAERWRISKATNGMSDYESCRFLKPQMLKLISKLKLTEAELKETKTALNSDSVEVANLTTVIEENYKCHRRIEQQLTITEPVLCPHCKRQYQVQDMDKLIEHIRSCSLVTNAGYLGKRAEVELVASRKDRDIQEEEEEEEDLYSACDVEVDGHRKSVKIAQQTVGCPVCGKQYAAVSHHLELIEHMEGCGLKL